MSDNDSDTPLDFSQFDCDEYPEAVENSARKLPKEDSPFVWTPECLEIMKRYGCGPEDMENIPEEDSESEEEENSDDEDQVGKLVCFLHSFNLMLT